MKRYLFNYNLPPDLIAQNPLEKRDGSRLLVCDAMQRSISDHFFQELPELLNSIFELPKHSARLLLIVNNSFVYPARVRIKRKTGARGEVFFLERGKKDSYECLLRPQNKLKIGEVLYADQEEDIPIIKVVSLNPPRVSILVDDIENYGEVPLPPYIQRALQRSDTERYQTVYANKNEIGSAAAPTAGLHFNEQIIKKCKNFNIDFASVTLHVGLGTFAPVQTENITDHPMHEEYYYIGSETVQKIEEFRNKNWPIIFVGTTALRAVESFYRALSADLDMSSCGLRTSSAESLSFIEKWHQTRLFLYPEHKTQRVLPCVGNGILTNFHQPESTLTMLVAALMGYDFWKEFYSYAIDKRYRFLSYGDSSLLLFRKNSIS